MMVTEILIVVGTLVTVPKNLGKGLGGTGDQRKTQDHSDYSTVKIS